MKYALQYNFNEIRAGQDQPEQGVDNTLVKNCALKWR